MSTQTDTPETNAAIELCSDPNGAVELCDLCQKLERERNDARTQIQMMIEHDNRRLESDSIVASCDCLTKTNEVQYHKPGCKYRLICERDDARAATSGRTVSCSQCNETARQLEAMREAINQICVAMRKKDKSLPTVGEVRDHIASFSSENETMREAVKEAQTLLLAVDNGAQPDINGVNWYDARSLVLAKLQPFIKP